MSLLSGVQSYKSRLCATCDANFARGSGLGECQQCQKDTNVLIFLAGVAIATLGTLGLVKITVFKERKANFSDGVKKIALSYLQTVLLAKTMDVPWNKTFRQLFVAQATLTNISKAFFSLGCVLNTSAWNVFVVQYVSILCLPLFIAPLTYLGVKACSGGNDEVVSAIVLLFYLMYPTMLTYFTDLISCTEFIGKEQYLKLDPEVVCWKGEHLMMFCTGGLLLLLAYIVGLPLASLHFLKKSDLSLPGNQLRYGMLFDGYNEKYWWWEITVICRKVFIIIIGTFVKDTQQILCVLFVLASLIFSTAYCQPFLSNKLLYLELGSLALSFVTFWVGGMLITDPKCADDSGVWCEFSAYFVGIINVACIVYLAYVFATAKWKEKAEWVMHMVKAKLGCFKKASRKERRTWEINPLSGIALDKEKKEKHKKAKGDLELTGNPLYKK